MLSSAMGYNRQINVTLKLPKNSPLGKMKIMQPYISRSDLRTILKGISSIDI